MTGRKVSIFQDVLVLALLMSLGLAGCASPGPEDYSQRVAEGGPQQCNEITEDDIETDTASTTGGGVAVGAVLGAVFGALLGVAGGGDGRDVAAMAAVGAGAGGVVGGVDGYDVAQQKKRYAVQEARLDCQLQAAKEDNAKLDQLLASLQTSISNNMRRIGELEAEFKAKSMNAEEVRAELASMDATTAQMERALAQMKNRKQQYESARDANNKAADGNLNTVDLDRNISDLNNKIAEADAALDKLVERRKVAQIG
jgi:outer membrane lipoprotein SlyB